MRRLRLLAFVLSLTFAPLSLSAVASARVPKGFVGLMPAPPIFNRGVNLGHQLDVMVASGVESLRVEFDWNAAQPYAKESDVPAAKRKNFTIIGGVPTSFASTDGIVGLAAKRGLSILGVVLVTPTWAAGTHLPATYNLPASNSTYAHFLTALVQRYGPNGSFWREHPTIKPVPIRMWQIWNEPNLQLYWPDTPFAPGYVAMLSAAHAAIKDADPGAKVVLAGMPNFVWDDLATIYAVHGARRLFDAVAVHPFTSQPAGVITILQKVRDVMNKNGDSRKPMLATEVSWPSSVGKSSQSFGFETTEAGQASRVAALLPTLASDRKRLGLSGFYWYTWVGRELRGDKSFSFAGLFRLRNNKFVAKPAYTSFRRAALSIEGCKVKSSVATRCARR
jgi:polysaccharide biosynthesis protein PslG